MDTANDRTNYDSEYPPPSFPPRCSKKHRACGKRNSFPREKYRILMYRGINREKRIFYSFDLYDDEEDEKGKRFEIVGRASERNVP